MSKQQTISRHLDKTVIRLFLVVFLFSASVFAYRYSEIKPCENVIFETDAKAYRVGEIIAFKDFTDNAKSWTWKFGDSSDVVSGKEPLHIYKKPGEYTINLMVNDICDSYKTITIQEKLFILDSTKLPVFTIPSSIKVGQTLRVKDETYNASTWEWNFGETATVNATERRANYKYTEPGAKTITLVVNGDVKHVRKKRINVLPVEGNVRPTNAITGTNRRLGQGIKALPLDEMNKQEDEKVVSIKDKPSTVPFISDADFTNKLLLVAEKSIDANAFKAYLCGDLNKTIVVNGEETSFLVFCETIKGRNLKIRELGLFRDKGSNCIKSITIKHRRLGIF